MARQLDVSTGELFGGGPDQDDSVPMNLTLAEIEAGLSLPIAPVFLGSKVKGGAKLTIFSVWTARKYLNYWAPGWSATQTISLSNERVAVNVQLSIPTSDRGFVTRPGDGDDSEDDDEMPDFESEEERQKWIKGQNQRGYGSPTTRASAQAFKRAAAAFGFGVYLRDRGKPLFVTDSVIQGGVQSFAADHPEHQPPKGQQQGQGQPTPTQAPQQSPPGRSKAFGGPSGELAQRTPTPPQIATQRANAEGSGDTPTPFDNFSRYATSSLEKIGAADTLITQYLLVVRHNLNLQGKLNSVEAMREALRLTRKFETTGEVVKYIGEITKASKRFEQEEMTDELFEDDGEGAKAPAPTRTPTQSTTADGGT